MKERYKLMKPAGNYKTWRYRDNAYATRPIRSTGCKTRKEALAFIKNLTRNNYTFSPKLKDFAKDFFVEGKCKWMEIERAKGRKFGKANAKKRRGHLVNHLLPRFGNSYIADITVKEVNDYLLSINLAPETKNKIIQTLRIILQHAMNSNIIKENICDRITRFAVNPKRKDILTIEEIQNVFPHDFFRLQQIWGGPKYATLYYLLFTSGLRSGEVRALKWEQVLFEHNAIVIENAINASGERGTTKTDTMRTITLPNSMIQILQMWKNSCPDSSSDAYVFPGRIAGSTLYTKTIVHNFREGLRRMGIDADNRNLVPHSLRHQYNTILINSSLSKEDVKSQTGHKTDAMYEHYSKQTAEDKAKLGKQKLSRLINEAFDGDVYPENPAV